MTKSQFIKRFKAMRGPWIKTKDEVLCGINEGYKDPATIYGIQKGYLRVGEVVNGYVLIYLTEKGLKLARETAESTCAFSGKSNCV